MYSSSHLLGPFGVLRDMLQVGWGFSLALKSLIVTLFCVLEYFPIVGINSSASRVFPALLVASSLIPSISSDIDFERSICISCSMISDLWFDLHLSKIFYMFYLENISLFTYPDLFCNDGDAVIVCKNTAAHFDSIPDAMFTLRRWDKTRTFFSVALSLRAYMSARTSPGTNAR